MKNLKLSSLETQKLNEKEMGMLNGGKVITVTTRACTCSCYYADKGGASINDDRDANYAIGEDGGKSAEGDNKHYRETVTVIVIDPIK